jgi:hypothetical protein
MPYKLRLSLPNIPKGVKVALHGLGEFANKQEHSISDDLADFFRAMNSKQQEVADAKPDEEGRVAYETVPGPTLLDAFKNVEGVSVVEVKTEGPVK